jgi:hypothetical protein
MTNIQVGDTVELIDYPLYEHYLHPTENRPLRVGDRVVVSYMSRNYYYYRAVNNTEFGILHWRFKKVINNQVEIKFR